VIDGLTIETDRQAYRPGESIVCRLAWRFVERPERIALSLLWYTEGKGDEDVAVLVRETLEDPGPDGQREFQLTAPAFPFSFSGQLITLTWALEALAEGVDGLERHPVVIAPEATELLL